MDVISGRKYGIMGQARWRQQNATGNTNILLVAAGVNVRVQTYSNKSVDTTDNWNTLYRTWVATTTGSVDFNLNGNTSGAGTPNLQFRTGSVIEVWEI